MRLPIPGFEGLYEIDTEGNVFSVLQSASRRKRQLKPFCNGSGYMKVNLYDLDGKCAKKYLHRLVAETFIPNPDNLPVVNHKDSNQANNTLDNLEWCSQSENVKHTYDVGGRKSNAESNIGNNHRGKTVVINKDGKSHTFPNMKTASLYFKVNCNYISELCRKEQSNVIHFRGFRIEVMPK